MYVCMHAYMVVGKEAAKWSLGDRRVGFIALRASSRGSPHGDRGAYKMVYMEIQGQGHFRILGGLAKWVK